MKFAARVLRKLARIIDPDRTLHVEEIDLFPTWLSYANAGWLDKGNRYCMDYAMQRLPSDAPIVEIGSFCGLSTNFLAYYLRKHGRANLLFNTDPWLFEGATGGRMGQFSERTNADYRAFVIETFRRNAQMFSRENLPHAIERPSNDFFAAWRKGDIVTDLFGRNVKLGGPISFAYVDGDHLYEAAHADFVNCDEFLDVGGFVLFDDSPATKDLEGWGVSRVMQEVKDTGRYKLVMTNPNHLFQKVRHAT